MTTRSSAVGGYEAGDGGSAGNADAGIRSAARALQVLRAIGASPSGLTAAEIAAELGLGQATTYRLLSTLHDGDYIGRQPGVHRYILGRAVDELGRAVQSQLVVTPEVRAALRSVHDSAEAPAYLTVFRGDDIAVAHIEDSLRHPQITQLHVGFSEASHLTAFGKLMLASRDEAQLARYLERHGLRRRHWHPRAGTTKLESWSTTRTPCAPANASPIAIGPTPPPHSPTRATKVA